MVRLGLVVCMAAVLASAQDFKFTIGSPVAAQDFHFKSAAFVFRTENCAEPEKPQVSATAEGLVNGVRKSLPLKVAPSSKPGVYAVVQSWSGEGSWLVNLKGTCGSAQAGALIPIGPKGFVRETSKFLARPATAAEIETSLKAVAKGGNQ